jgi:hypothetical protein
MSANAAPTSLGGKNLQFLHHHRLQSPTHCISMYSQNRKTQSTLEVKQKLGNTTQHNHYQDNHDLEWQLATNSNPVHQIALHTAGIQILEYETTHPHPVIKQQPTIAYGMAYLRHRGTIINKRYNEEITYYYNWPKYCFEKFLWSTHTFNSVNWKAFQHQGKDLT